MKNNIKHYKKGTLQAMKAMEAEKVHIEDNNVNSGEENAKTERPGWLSI